MIENRFSQFVGKILSQRKNNAPALFESQNWTHFVRIGAYWLTDRNADRIIANAKLTHVFGIGIDNGITGRYESFLDPAKELKAIKTLARAAHKAGNRAFVYMTGLECITKSSSKTKSSLYKDHPDWVQRKITGEPALFGGGTAFWINAGDEDTWISPYATEWRTIYMQRVRQLAATGIDGIFVDVPHFMTHFQGWQKSWASFDDYTVQVFKNRTGLDARNDIRLGDFTDHGFIEWIEFRIETVTDFVKEIDKNVKAINPICMTIAEIHPGLENDATRSGADVYELYKVVDAIAHECFQDGGDRTTAAQTPKDWLRYLSDIYTFRSFAGERATWMLSYSWDRNRDTNHELCMKHLAAAQVFAAANAWDAEKLLMAGSNDMNTRAQIFKWIEEHEEIFYFQRKPLCPVGVYFSSRSRNFFPGDFIRSYRGILYFFMLSHLEFQVITSCNLSTFCGQMLVLADVKCLDDQELSLLEQFIQSGKTLIITGETANFDEKRNLREKNPVHELLGISDATATASSTTPKRFLYDPQCQGKLLYSFIRSEFNNCALSGDYQNSNFERVRLHILKEIYEITQPEPAVTIAASPLVSAEIAEVGGKTHVFLINLKGLQSKQLADDTSARNVEVIFNCPDTARAYMLPFLGDIQELAGDWHNGKLTCLIPEIVDGLVVWLDQVRNAPTRA